MKKRRERSLRYLAFMAIEGFAKVIKDGTATTLCSAPLFSSKIDTYFQTKKRSMPTVVIGGGSGLVGQRLSHQFKERGYRVCHYSRTENLQAEFPAYAWNPSAGELDPRPLREADYVINLAGAGIADQRWTEQRKRLIIKSRVETTRLLCRQIQDLKLSPKAFLSAAAIGYYGDRDDEWLTEDSEPGREGFLPESCKQWEAAIREVPENTGVRTAWVRIGLVLSTRGGALEKIIAPIHFRLGTYFGDGRQWYSWVHIDDIARAFVHLAETDGLSGPFNGVAPKPVRNRDFVKEIMDALDKPGLLLPAPGFALRLALGEMAEAVLSGSKVSAKKLQEAGFEFEHPELKEAVEHLIKEKI